jgi:hypothetical protein
VTNVDLRSTCLQCAHCQGTEEHPDKKVHKQINLLVSRLDEQQRCWFVAVETNRHGYGGVSLLSQITGMDEKMIERGQQELEEDLVNRPEEQVRSEGGGCPLVEKIDPAIERALQEIVAPETAGSPMSEQEWVRSSLGHLSEGREGAGIRLAQKQWDAY